MAAARQRCTEQEQRHCAQDRVPLSGTAAAAGRPTLAGQTTVTLPQAVWGTGFYILVETNVGSSPVYEGGAVLNNAGTGSPLEIVLSPAPDLTIKRFEFPASMDAGQTQCGAVVFANDGAGAPFEFTWRNLVYFGSSVDSPTGTLLLSSVAYRPFAPEQERVYSFCITAPQRSSGTMYLVAITDSPRQVFEHDKENNNNVLSHALRIDLTFPDLMASDVQVDLDTLNRALHVRWTVTNVGNATFPRLSNIPSHFMLSEGLAFDPHASTNIALAAGNLFMPQLAARSSQQGARAARHRQRHHCGFQGGARLRGKQPLRRQEHVRHHQSDVQSRQPVR